MESYIKKAMSILLVIMTYAVQAQVKFYEVKFNGGVTAAGYSPGTSTVANGVFNIHIANGSTIKKAYLFCGELGNGGSANFLLDGNTVNFANGFTQVSPSFNNPLYGGTAAVHAVDVTPYILPGDSVYTFTGIQTNSTLNFFTDFYLYVAYENPLLPQINSAIFLNDQGMAPTISHGLKLQSKFPSSGDISLAFLMGYMCGNGDGENVSVNGSLLGTAWGPDANNLPGSCGGPAASFAHEANSIIGLNDDNPNSAINGPDVLSEISAYVTPLSDSLYIQYDHVNASSVDNSIWLVTVNFNEAIEIYNFCFGDTTFFSIQDSAGFAAVQWNFDDPSSGPNNVAYTALASHIFTDTGTYNVTLIRAMLTPPFADTLYFAVTINPIPDLWLGNDTTLCNGQIINLAPGIFNTYLWNNGNTTAAINITSAGTYSLEVSVKGCFAGDTIVINFIPCAATVANLSCTDTIFCEKQCIDFFDLSTNSPTSWQWNFQGAQPDTSTAQNPQGICYNNYGAFNVQLVACNGVGCDTLLLPAFINEIQSPPPPVVIIANDTLLCTATNVTYAWYSVLNPSIVLGTNNFFIPPAAGTYYVVVLDTNGCEVPSGSIAMNVGWHNLSALPFHMNYNGTENILEINCGEQHGDEATITIYDMAGRVILGRRITCRDQKLVLPINFACGIYQVMLINEKTWSTTRFVK